jgi:hypothetical protein
MCKVELVKCTIGQNRNSVLRYACDILLANASQDNLMYLDFDLAAAMLCTKPRRTI